MENLRDYINQLRHDFMQMHLDETMIDADPVVQFGNWFKQAVDGHAREANAFVLSTVGNDMKPSARILLLRDFNENGFVFYTNYNSRKSQNIAENPNACMTFFWPELERQVRIEGRIVKQSAAESDLYFANRPRSSRLGAWSSPQSEIIADRKALDDILADIEKKFEGKDVPRPDWWGGYVLIPDHIEFWQGRPSRLHDRIAYMKSGNNWKTVRLAP